MVTTPRSAKSISSWNAASWRCRVAAGEAVQDNQQGIAFANQGEPLGVVGMGPRHQAGRVEKLDRSRGDLLGFVKRGQEIQSRVGKRGDSCLTAVNPGRVGSCSREQLK